MFLTQSLRTIIDTEIYHYGKAVGSTANPRNEKLVLSLDECTAFIAELDEHGKLYRLIQLVKPVQRDGATILIPLDGTDVYLNNMVEYSSLLPKLCDGSIVLLYRNNYQIDITQPIGC